MGSGSSGEEEGADSVGPLAGAHPVSREEMGWRKYLEWKIKKIFSLALLIAIVDRNSHGC